MKVNQVSSFLSIYNIKNFRKVKTRVGVLKGGTRYKENVERSIKYMQIFIFA